MEEIKRPSIDELFDYASKGDIKALSELPVNLLSSSDGTGLRIMHVAAQHGQTALIEWLVDDPKRDTGVNKPDEDARTPLHWAAWYGKADSCQALLEMGAIRDRPTRTGFTPLHYAAYCGDLPTVKVLVEYGANVDARDESQQKPKDVAHRFEHTIVAKYLEDEAPAISREARKKFPAIADEGDAKMVLDPMVENVQINEQQNLERILHTAKKVIEENPPLPAFPDSAVSKSNTRFNNLLFGLVVFASTLVLGFVIGKRKL